MSVKIGWGRREFSTNEPVMIPGQMHMRISKGIMDPLFVTAMCVEGEQAVVFVSADVISISQTMLDTVQALLTKQRPEIPWESVIFNATHTHASVALYETVKETPDGKKIFPGIKTVEHFSRMAVEAICEAWDSRKEGGIGYGYGYAVVGYSRRVVYFKDQKLAETAAGPRQFMTPPGYAVMYGKTNDPLFSHLESGADHFLNLMFTFDGARKLTGIVVNVPCPSQVGGQLEMLSADYWADVRRLVAEEFGADVYVLPQCAAAGDLAPHMVHYRNAQVRRMSLKYGKPYEAGQVKNNNEYYFIDVKARRMDMAEQILLGIKDVYSWAKKDIQTDVAVRCRAVDIPMDRRKVSQEDKAWCEENLEMLKDMTPSPEGLTDEEYRKQLTTYNSRVNRNKRGIERYELAKNEPQMPTRSWIVQIGDIAFATTRFEIYQDFMHRLQARSPFIQTFVIQLAGDSGTTYLATQRAIEAKGYSASMFCNSADAEGGQQWVEASLDVLNSLAESK